MVGTATRKRLGRRGERRSVRASAWGAAGATPALALAIAAAGGAAALIVLRHPGWAGALTLAGGAALLAGWWLTDQIPQRDPRARFAAMLADPIFDVCLLASIAWAARHTSARVSVLALVALGLSYLASYMRARADSLSYRTVEGLGYRATRAGLLALGLLTGRIEAALWTLVALGALATAARAANVALQERRQ